jgi:hypothetical protein
VVGVPGIAGGQQQPPGPLEARDGRARLVVSPVWRQTARSRTKEYGANYPKVSQTIWTAIQASITGTSSVSSALQTAQGTISSVQQVSGG